MIFHASFKLLSVLLLLPTFFYLPFTLFHFILCISFPSTFLSCALFSCPSMICSYPFIVPPCHVQNFTDRIFGMHDRGHHGGHNLYVWILKDQMHTHTKHFLLCSAISLSFLVTFLSCVLILCQFPFTSFHVPSISFNHIFVLRSSYFISLLSFCFFMSSGVPLISLSVRLIFLLVFLSCPFHSASLVTSVSVPFPSSHSVFLVCPVIV